MTIEEKLEKGADFEKADFEEMASVCQKYIQKYGWKYDNIKIVASESGIALLERNKPRWIDYDM